MADTSSGPDQFLADLPGLQSQPIRPLTFYVVGFAQTQETQASYTLYNILISVIYS